VLTSTTSLHRIQGPRLKMYVCSLLCLFLLTAQTTFAQFAQRGAISGSVQDASGAAVSGAEVDLLDVARSETVKATTGANGLFQFSGLVAGQYLLKVQKPGFETANSSPITVDIGVTLKYDLKLKAGSVTEQITVSSESPILDTGSASVATEISQKQLDDLPINGLNFTSLAALTPGVSTTVQNNINPGGSFAVGSQFSSGGVSFTSGGLIQGSRDNGYYVNGVNINDNYESSISYEPASAALQDAKIDVANFSAANGHDISTFSIQTKGGTTQFHGMLYENLENDDLNATNPYDKAIDAFFDQPPPTKPTLKRNQFGGGIGGPVLIPKVHRLKDHLFFFVNYENFLEHDGAQQVQASVPSAAERTGDFSELLTGDPSAQLQLYNPYTTTYDSEGNSMKVPIAGNRVDLATKPDGTPLIDPASAPILALYPLPNVPNSPSYQTNFITTQNDTFANDHVDTRFDARITDKDSVFVTYSRQHGTTDAEGGVFTNFQYNNDDKGYLVTVNEAHIFTPNLSNEFIFGIGKSSLTIVSASELAYLNSAANPLNSIFQNTGLGITHGVLGVDVDNYASIGFDQDFLASNRSLQFSDNLTWTRGHHAITAGMNYFRKGEYDYDFNRYVSFGGFSQGGVNNAVAPYYSQGGDGAADLIMGLPRHIHQLDQIVGGDATAPELNVVFPYWGGYINDRFQMTPKLTITAGLRYDLSIPIYGLSDACCAVYQPDANGGTVALPGVADGVPQHYLSADKREFAPRLSIAYAPTRKQVVRVGYGIFHDSGATQISTAVGFADGASPGGGLDLTSSILGYSSNTPVLHLSDVFPAEPALAPGVYPVSTGKGRGYFGDGALEQIFYNDQKSTPLPYYQRFILDFQQEIDPATSVTVSYVGAQGRKGTNSFNINLPPYAPGSDQDETAFDASRPNNSGRFSDIYVARPNLNSFYNAGIIAFNHRFAHGFQALSNYTWGKTVSDYPYINNLAYNGAPGQGSGGFQYPNVRNRGESTLSHPQRFVFSGIYSPAYGAKWSPWARTAFAGVRLSGILTMESGDALTVVNGESSSNDDAGPEQAIITGNPNLSHGSKSFNQQFNIAAFSAPPDNVRANSGLGNVRGPGQNNVDLSLAKSFKIYDRTHLDLRVDAFNAFNHTQWNGADIYLGDSTFGQPSGAREARIAQVAAKLIF
jgi:hypothetical protein